MAFLCNWILFSNKENWNHNIFLDQDGTWHLDVKWLDFSLSLFFFYHTISALSSPSPGYHFSIAIRCLEHFHSFEALAFSKFVLCLPDLEYWPDLQQLPLTFLKSFENGPWIRNTAAPKEIKRHQRSVLHV